MKTLNAGFWIMVCAACGAAAALADPAATTARPEKYHTGTVIAVDPQEKTLEITGFLSPKKFTLGAACRYALLDPPVGTASDLRPGEKVVVSYQDAHGVCLADRIEQQPMELEGLLVAVDASHRTLTLRRSNFDRQLQIPDGCKIVLHKAKAGTLADLQMGNHVTVTYETPDDELTAREIAQTSIVFTGTLTAIDLQEKTLKARAAFSTRKFILADHCAIVINGKADGQLASLKPNDKLVFSYDEINGVNVLNRIAPAAQVSPVPSTPAPVRGD